MAKKKTSKKKGNKSRKLSAPRAKSAAGKSPTPATSTAGDPADPAPAANRAMPKTRYRPEELEEFRQLLLTKRAELVGDVTHMTDRNRPAIVGKVSGAAAALAICEPERESHLSSETTCL